MKKTQRGGCKLLWSRLTAIFNANDYIDIEKLQDL